MKATRHNGRAGKHGAYNPKHVILILDMGLCNKNVVAILATIFIYA